MGGSQFTMTLWMGLSQTPEMTMGAAPILVSEVCDNPVHGVMVNWDPPKPAGWRQVPDPTMTEHGICPRASICYIYSGVK